MKQTLLMTLALAVVLPAFAQEGPNCSTPSMTMVYADTQEPVPGVTDSTRPDTAQEKVWNLWLGGALDDRDVEFVRPNVTCDVPASPVFALAPDPDPDPQPDPDPSPDPEPVSSAVFGAEYLGRTRVRNWNFTKPDGRPAFGHGAFAVRDGYLWLASHVYFNGVGKFGPIDLQDGPLSSAPMAENVLPFVRIREPIPGQSWPIMGVYDDGEKVWVTTQEYYDANGDETDSLSILNYDGSVDQFYETKGAARSAGWIQEIPERWQDALGGTHLLGSSKNIPINHRHSIGPSLYAFDGTPGGAAAARPWMVFSLKHPMSSYDLQEPVGDPVFNELSKVWTCFIWEDDYICVGRTGALESAIRYKVRTTGYDAVDPNDYHNYYWRFRLQDIVDADNPHDPRPYEWGKLEFEHSIRGAYFDDREAVLYLISYMDDSQPGPERPPVIFGYQF